MASIIRSLRPLSRAPTVRLAGKRLAAGRPVQRYRFAHEHTNAIKNKFANQFTPIIARMHSPPPPAGGRSTSPS